MNLDRNTNDAGVGKYAIINLRKLESMCNNPPTLGRWTPDVEQALSTLGKAGAIEWGRTGEQEYADAVLELSKRAGKSSPFCKVPESIQLVPACAEDAMASLADRARRIAACVAACDGISTETLEAAGVDRQFWPIDLARNSRKGLISLLGIQNFTVQGLKKEVESSSRKKLKIQRGELLGALKACEAALTLIERETGQSYSATINARTVIDNAAG